MDAYTRLEGATLIYAGSLIAETALLARNSKDWPDRKFYMEAVKRNLTDLTKAVEAADAAFQQERDAA